MIRTYVVNMEKDADKRSRILSQMAEQEGLDCHLFKAVEGRRLSDEELGEMVDFDALRSRYGNKATLPAVGCSLSHIAIYEDIANGDADYALVLEDDALLSPNLSEKLSGLRPWLVRSEPTAILLTPEFVYNEREGVMRKKDFSLYKIGNGFMTSGYVINKSGASLLSGSLRPVRYLADEWGSFVAMGLSLYGVVPHLVSYPEGLGEIGRSQLEEQRRPLLLRLKSKVGQFLFKTRMMLLAQKGIRMSRKRW